MENYKCSVCGKEIDAKSVHVYVKNEILDKDKLWCESNECFKKSNKK